MLDSHGNLKSETLVYHYRKHAIGGIDRCMPAVNGVFVMIHLTTQVSIVQVRAGVVNLVARVQLAGEGCGTGSALFRSDSELLVAADANGRGIARLALVFN